MWIKGKKNYFLYLVNETLPNRLNFMNTGYEMHVQLYYSNVIVFNHLRLLEIFINNH